MPRAVKRLTVSGALAAFAVLGAAVGLALGGSAGPVKTYRATMSPGVAVPKPKAPIGAKGVFTASVTEIGAVRTIRWKLTFGGLSGKAVAAHIHRGKVGFAGGVLVPLCGPCRNGQTGQAKITKDVADVLERALAYVNLHTAKNPAGEVRGQVKLLGGGGIGGGGVTTTSDTTTTDSGGGTTTNPYGY